MDAFTYEDDAGWERVKGKADAVFDTVGGDALLRSLRAAKFGARILVVGWTSTPLVRATQKPNQFPTNLLLMKSLDVLGCPVVIHTQRDPSIRRARLAHLDALAEQGKLAPLLREFPADVSDPSKWLQAVRSAFQAKATRGVVGTCVVSW